MSSIYVAPDDGSYTPHDFVTTANNRVAVSHICREQYIKVSDLPKIVEYVKECIRLESAFDEQEFLSIISGEEHE